MQNAKPFHTTLDCEMLKYFRSFDRPARQLIFIHFSSSVHFWLLSIRFYSIFRASTPHDENSYMNESPSRWLSFSVFLLFFSF